eukprot:TRINITY_DN8385_c0_g1_i2.p1 TRINITY_DN8385_c0_g1~~TRINITY_DN8385_c0_g1_i2.p1  ORF type:complete len:612 (+),score=165.43 TRINITY_DN8385_c0_g1_i2:87-1922(+)
MQCLAGVLFQRVPDYGGYGVATSLPQAGWARLKRLQKQLRGAQCRAIDAEAALKRETAARRRAEAALQAERSRRAELRCAALAPPVSQAAAPSPRSRGAACPLSTSPSPPCSPRTRAAGIPLQPPRRSLGDALGAEGSPRTRSAAMELPESPRARGAALDEPPSPQAVLLSPPPALGGRCTVREGSAESGGSLSNAPSEVPFAPLVEAEEQQRMQMHWAASAALSELLALWQHREAAAAQAAARVERAEGAGRLVLGAERGDFMCALAAEQGALLHRALAAAQRAEQGRLQCLAAEHAALQRAAALQSAAARAGAAQHAAQRRHVECERRAELAEREASLLQMQLDGLAKQHAEALRELDGLRAAISSLQGETTAQKEAAQGRELAQNHILLSGGGGASAARPAQAGAVYVADSRGDETDVRSAALGEHRPQAIAQPSSPRVAIQGGSRMPQRELRSRVAAFPTRPPGLGAAAFALRLDGVAFRVAAWVPREFSRVNRRGAAATAGPARHWHHCWMQMSRDMKAMQHAYNRGCPLLGQPILKEIMTFRSSVRNNCRGHYAEDHFVRMIDIMQHWMEICYLHFADLADAANETGMMMARSATCLEVFAAEFD